MELADKLRPHVEAIKSAASKGDKKAKQVIDLYRLHCACPSDPGAVGLCSAAFDDWHRNHRA